jgi:hypothetical protein
MSETTSGQRDYFQIATAPSTGEESIDYFGRYSSRIVSDLVRLARQAGVVYMTESLSRPGNVRGYDLILEQVRNFQGLNDGWDGPGSKPPTLMTYQASVLALVTFMVLGAPAPRLLIMRDGTVGAYWKSGKIYGSIDFEEDGEHLWVCTDGTDYWNGTWQPGKSLAPTRMWALPSPDRD